MEIVHKSSSVVNSQPNFKLVAEHFNKLFLQKSMLGNKLIKLKEEKNYVYSSENIQDINNMSYSILFYANMLSLNE